MRQLIEQAWENRELLKEKEYKEAVEEAVAQLDCGTLRVAEPQGNGEWQVNEWVKKAVLLYDGVPRQDTAEARL